MIVENLWITIFVCLKNTVYICPSVNCWNSDLVIIQMGAI